MLDIDVQKAAKVWDDTGFLDAFCGSLRIDTLLFSVYYLPTMYIYSGNRWRGNPGT